MLPLGMLPSPLVKAIARDADIGSERNKASPVLTDEID